MKKISLQELRSLIKNVIKEAGEFPSIDAGMASDEDWAQEYPDDVQEEEEENITASDVDSEYGDGTVDELAGFVGYDDIAGDHGAIDQKFYFEKSFDTVNATDRYTGTKWIFEPNSGLWEEL